MTDKAKQDTDSIEVSDARKHPFYVLDNDLIGIYGPKIGVYGIAVYNVLAYYANKKDMAWPSYQTIADHLGMSRRKVITAIDSLVACGLVKKDSRYTPSGDKTSNNYILVSIHGEGSKHGALGSAHNALPSAPHTPHSEHGAPRGSAPPARRGAQGAQEQDPMNKTQSSEQDLLNKNTATQPAMQEKTLTPQQAMFGAVCEAVGWDHHTITDKSKAQVAQAVAVLLKANYTVEDIRRFMVDIWFHDWRWEKNQQRPTLSQLREDIGKLRAITPEHVPRNGKQPTSKADRNVANVHSVFNRIRNQEVQNE